MNARRSITLIIPVYRNLAATRRCLDSVLASTLPPDTQILVIDDASPEPELSRYCTELAQHPQIRSLANQENLGFVATVNRGINEAPERDVVLLNSDTEVANDWLVRLARTAYAKEQIGTVTPFSNNASVCSYPLPLRDNPLPEGWAVAELDALFAQANPGQHTVLPTAVGFCMYIKRDCLEQIGLFDEEHFGIGYGEECDFSMRVRAAGRDNVLAADVFVFHEGGQSFAGLTDQRIAAAEQTLARIHPDYHVIATRFIDEDPLCPLRDAVDDQRVKQRPGDAGAVLSGLRTHRDALTASKTNRERATEHALSELRARDSRWRYLVGALNRLDRLRQGDG